MAKSSFESFVVEALGWGFVESADLADDDGDDLRILLGASVEIRFGLELGLGLESACWLRWFQQTYG